MIGFHSIVWNSIILIIIYSGGVEARLGGRPDRPHNYIELTVCQYSPVGAWEAGGSGLMDLVVGKGQCGRKRDRARHLLPAHALTFLCPCLSLPHLCPFCLSLSHNLIPLCTPFCLLSPSLLSRGKGEGGGEVPCTP